MDEHHGLALTGTCLRKVSPILTALILLYIISKKEKNDLFFVSIYFFPFVFISLCLIM